MRSDRRPDMERSVTTTPPENRFRSSNDAMSLAVVSAWASCTAPSRGPAGVARNHESHCKGKARRPNRNSHRFRSSLKFACCQRPSRGCCKHSSSGLTKLVSSAAWHVVVVATGRITSSGRISVG